MTGCIWCHKSESWFKLIWIVTNVNTYPTRHTGNSQFVNTWSIPQLQRIKACQSKSIDITRLAKYGPPGVLPASSLQHCHSTRSPWTKTHDYQQRPPGCISQLHLFCLSKDWLTSVGLGGWRPIVWQRTMLNYNRIYRIASIIRMFILT
jgi:hypothetical protein